MLPQRRSKMPVRAASLFGIGTGLVPLSMTRRTVVGSVRKAGEYAHARRARGAESDGRLRLRNRAEQWKVRDACEQCWET